MSKQEIVARPTGLRLLKEKWNDAREKAFEKKVKAVCARLTDEEFHAFWDKIRDKNYPGFHFCILLSTYEHLLSQDPSILRLYNKSEIVQQNTPSRIMFLSSLQQKVAKIAPFGIMNHKTFVLVEAEYQKRFPELSKQS